MTAATAPTQMAWTNSLSYFSDNPGLKKTLLKMLVIETSNATATKQQQADMQQQMDIKQNVGDDRLCICVKCGYYTLDRQARTKSLI